VVVEGAKTFFPKEKKKKKKKKKEYNFQKQNQKKNFRNNFVARSFLQQWL
jgi:hypothetical protein